MSDGEGSLAGGTEIEIVQADRTNEFWKEHERAALSVAYDFSVVWHEQYHNFVAVRQGRITGALRLRIAASLAHVEALYVLEAHRGTGMGRALLARGEELANYYNCHKVTLQIAERSASRAFFEACGYHAEAIVPQHTFKLDIAFMRKFLL